MFNFEKNGYENPVEVSRRRRRERDKEMGGVQREINVRNTILLSVESVGVQFTGTNSPRIDLVVASGYVLIRAINCTIYILILIQIPHVQHCFEDSAEHVSSVGLTSLVNILVLRTFFFAINKHAVKKIQCAPRGCTQCDLNLYCASICVHYFAYNLKH